MNDRIKKILSWAGIVLLFLALSYAYMYPVLEGKIVNQSDISGWTGMTHEIVEHNKANPDDPTLWTNSMFGGMPSVTMYDDFDGDLTNPLYRFLLLGRRPATYIFIALLGSLFLLLAAGCGKAVAVAGAIAMAFCSYNMQIIQVGHNTKMQAIAFFPWVLAALIYTYRSAEKEGKLRDWLPYVSLGAVLFAFALSFQIKANHPQITWYLAATVFIYAAGELIYLLCKRERRRGLGRFFAASALLLVIGCAGIATNANKLLPTWNYAKYTMRGGSELSREDGSAGSKGLELDYATAWSYGIEETPNLVIPDYNGGASASELGKDSASSRELQKYGYKGRQLDQVLEGMPTYWGPQPFTAGPMYIGALSFFLFLLGCLLCSGKEKWWLIAASIFALLLAWGSHFMGFTKLCFNLLPMYNKFRTVSMALIVLQYTRPLRDKAIVGEFVQASYRSSAAVLGVAFIQNIYGTAGMAPLMILGSVPLFNIFAVLILMIESPENRGAPTPKQLLKGVATNPILLGIITGTVFALLPFSLPTIATKTLNNLASVTTPLALLSIGASFEGAKAIKKLVPTLVAALLKTVGLAAVFVPVAVALGFRNEELIALLIMLGSPTTPSSYVMAKNMGHEGVLTSSCIATTTLLSALTLTGWIFLLRSGGYL